MDWNQYSSAAEFLELARPVFLGDEALYGLPLGIAEDVASDRRPLPQPARWGAATEGASIRGLYFQTLPWPMHWMPLRDDVDESLLNHLVERGGLPDHMQATETQIRRFSDIRCAKTGETTTEGHLMRCHRLDGVDMPSPMPAGHMRLAQPQENDLLCQWAYRFAVDCKLREVVERGVPEQVPYLADDDLFLWEVDGQPVASAALTRSSPNGRTISFVYTPDDLRGNGYASALVGSLSQHVLDSGKSFVTLFTDLKNPTSNKIYHRLGYRPVEDFLVIEFSQPSS